MSKFNFVTTTKTLLFIATGSNLITSPSKIRQFTRTCSILPHPYMMLLKLPQTLRRQMTISKFYCPLSWRLPILHLPLQLFHHRKQFLRVGVLTTHQLLRLLPPRNQFYLKMHPQLCARARTHTQARLLPPPQLSSEFTCRRSRLSRCLFFNEGRDWQLMTI